MFLTVVIVDLVTGSTAEGAILQLPGIRGR